MNKKRCCQRRETSPESGKRGFIIIIITLSSCRPYTLAPKYLTRIIGSREKQRCAKGASLCRSQGMLGSDLGTLKGSKRRRNGKKKKKQNPGRWRKGMGDAWRDVLFSRPLASSSSSETLEDYSFSQEREREMPSNRDGFTTSWVCVALRFFALRFFVCLFLLRDSRVPFFLPPSL
eukprot:scaffold6899_cov183-Amphora_coffeaeformis.AAC.5